MRTVRLALVLFALAPALVYVIALNSCSGGSGNGSTSTSTSSGSPRIQHVVIIFQENRTPDNLFHGLPNADIANTGVNSTGQTIALQPASLAGSYDLGHKHSDFVSMYDNGKMDGADQVSCEPVAGSVCPANPQFLYVNPSEVAPYFQLAQQYTFGSYRDEQSVCGGESLWRRGLCRVERFMGLDDRCRRERVFADVSML